MRVLVLSDLWVPFPGGAERLMFNLSRVLLGRGHHVAAFTGYENPQQFDGPLVVRTDLPLDEHGWYLVETMVEAFAPDVIVTHHLYARTWERELCALGIPLVQVVLNGKRIKGAALAVFISRWVAERADADPLDLIVYPPAFDDMAAPSHDHAVGFIKPIEHKGVELVYDIAQLMPDRQFVVLRGEWQTLELIRDDLPNVQYVEPVDDMRDFYRLVDVVLVPSISEDAGTVAQECTVNGIPCVSSAVDGLVETNAGGVLLDSRDPRDWTRTIAALDGTLARRMVVERMTRVLDSRAGQLDVFAERVAALAQ